MNRELCDVAIVGAGPYGLSIAAHLQAQGIKFRIFGEPMGFWAKHMPEGMHLKSEGFASSLCDPAGSLTLREYCKQNGIPYADSGVPVPREVFIAYGQEFQRRFAPNLERKKVLSVKPLNPGFALDLDSGESVHARRVIVAVGLAYYASVPDELSGIQGARLTHSSDHGPCAQLSGRDVAIVGAGASAADLAAVLCQHGVRVHMLVRGAQVRFQDPPSGKKPSLSERLKNPVTGIGPGWKLWLIANLPLVFRRMPSKFRVKKVHSVLGPAPCWFTREQLTGKVDVRTGITVTSASMKEGRIHLETQDKQGGTDRVIVDHVISATGYEYDVDRIEFLDSALRKHLRRVGTLPALSSNFESSVRGLYFVGVTAAYTFGPLLRFAFGAEFAAPRIARHLVRAARRRNLKSVETTAAGLGMEQKAAMNAPREK
jgi:cation diffusion facilitator CzcD-associated flavoprotein CzcO